MITYYPYFNHVMDEFRHLAGGQGGILAGIVAPMVKLSSEPYMRSMTGNMPNYHKITYNDPTKDVQYHISGYGIYNEEAFVKFMGESVERYAPVATESLFKKDAIYASYNQIKKRGNKVLPLKYINIFSSNQQQEISRLIPEFSYKHINEDDILGWIECPSLLNPGENIWVPLQLMLVGFVKNKLKNEEWVTPSFSTGTAAHRTTENALLNAIVEYIQIDSFILSWYTKKKSKKLIIDDPVILNILEKTGLGKNSAYEILPYYMTMPDLDLPSVMIILKRKDEKLPSLVLGVQGDLDIRNALLRGIFEATAIINMNIYFTLYDPTKTIHANLYSDFADLDTNVLYYGTPGKDKIINETIENLSGEEILLSSLDSHVMSTKDQLEYLLRELKKISEYAVYLDVTPPELYGKDWSVVRVLIPELCAMCFPGFPFEEHPRVKQYGGVVNEYPHPLP